MSLEPIRAQFSVGREIILNYRDLSNMLVKIAGIILIIMAFDKLQHQLIAFFALEERSFFYLFFAAFAPAIYPLRRRNDKL